MKAKVKSSGEIVDVKLVKFDYTKDNYIDDNGEVYYADDLDFNLEPQKQSVTIEGYVAKDKGGVLCLFNEYPNRFTAGIWMANMGYGIKLPEESFPDLKWEDAPLKCKITIKEI